MEVTNLKTDLRSISHDLTALNLNDDNDLVKLEKTLRDDIYECFLRMKRLL